MKRFWKAREGGQSGGPAMVGQVGLSDGSGVSVVGDFLHRRLPLFAPPGYHSLPQEGEQVLLLTLEDGLCALGTRQAGTGLLPGELLPGEVRLTSVGGASLWLKADGEVEINGLRITREGTVIPKGGA